MVEAVVKALFLGVQGGLLNVEGVRRPLRTAHDQPGAPSAFLHRRVEFSLGLTIEQPPRLAFRGTVGPQQERPAVYGDVQFLRNNIEPAQAHVAEGSSVVLPDSDLDGIAGSHSSHFLKMDLNTMAQKRNDYTGNFPKPLRLCAIASLR